MRACLGQAFHRTRWTGPNGSNGGFSRTQQTGPDGGFYRIIPKGDRVLQDRTLRGFRIGFYRIGPRGDRVLQDRVLQ